MVFPARAGMSPNPPYTLTTHWSVPRASGDEPETADKGLTRVQCSPRERG